MLFVVLLMVGMEKEEILLEYDSVEEKTYYLPSRIASRGSRAAGESMMWLRV